MLTYNHSLFLNAMDINSEFSYFVFAQQVKQMSTEQARQMLITIYEQMLICEVLYEELLNS
jgi:hypothetical protein